MKRPTGPKKFRQSYARLLLRIKRAERRLLPAKEYRLLWPIRYRAW